MKSLVLLILLLSILYINCDDCGTPVECYVKAINILNSDRAEMRIMNSHNQELINQLKIEIQGLNTKIVNLKEVKRDIKDVYLVDEKAKKFEKVSVFSKLNDFVQKALDCCRE